jgi:hypothetical protein
MGVDMPETRYAHTGDVSIAYQVLGEGPFDVVIAPGFVSHVELIWETAGTASFLCGIAKHARVLVFAASHPKRVSALVLYGGMARTLWAPDYLFGDTEREYRKSLEEELEAFVTPGALEGDVRSGSLPLMRPRSRR